jgi:hypothetical protein
MRLWEKERKTQCILDYGQAWCFLSFPPLGDALLSFDGSVPAGYPAGDILDTLDRLHH